jgi:hypothetical protein
MPVHRGVVRRLALVAALAAAVSVVGATAAFGVAARQTEQPRGSQPTEINISKDLKHRYGEPEIAVNPKNPKNLVYAVLTMGTTYACQKAKRPECTEASSAFGPQPAGLIKNKPGFSHVRVYVSFDSGKTWRRSADVPAFPPDHPQLVERGDPLITVGPNGTFYLGWDDIRFCDCDATIIDAGGIAISKSTDGGRTWSKPVLSGTPVGRPFFATDQSTGVIYEASSGQLGAPSEGNPDLPEIPITAPGDRWLVASRDGVHWSDPKPFGGVPTFPPGTFGDAANGMYGTAFRPSDPGLCDGTPGCIVFQTTTDEGATWSRHPVPVRSDATGAPLVAADPSAAGHFAVAALHAGQTEYLVYETRDAGATWTGPTTVTDDASKTHFHPWMAYSPKGVLGLMWQTNVNSAPAPQSGGLPAALPEDLLETLPESVREAIEAGQAVPESVLESLPEQIRESIEQQAAGPPSPYSVWAAISRDGGATFSAPLKISRKDSPAPQPFLPFGVGDDFRSSPSAVRTPTSAGPTIAPVTGRGSSAPSTWARSRATGHPVDPRRALTRSVH